MPDDLAAKLRPFGLKLPSRRGRDPEPANYARTVKIESARDLARVARAILDIFYNVFGYRGLTPMMSISIPKARQSTRLSTRR